MKRSLLVFSSILSITGAVGLITFGDALVGIIDGVMTYRFTSPPEPLPNSLGDAKSAAFSGMTLVVGLAISCIGTVMGDSKRTMSFVGRLLACMAGLTLLIGTVPLLWGIMGARSGFVVIATADMVPTAEDVREMVDASATMLLVGSTVLLVGTIAMLVAGQIGLRERPPQTSNIRFAFCVVIGMGSVFWGVVLALVFLGIWHHGNALEAIFAGTTLTPKPTELAEHLLGILNKSLLAFIGVGCLGITYVLAAVFAPAAGGSIPGKGWEDGTVRSEPT